MSIMLNQITNDDDDIYLKKEGIDRSFGYLVLGIVVLLFFLLTIVGMGRIHKMSDVSTSTNRYQSDEERASEIGGTQPVGGKN